MRKLLIFIAFCASLSAHAQEPDIVGRVTCKGKPVAGVILSDGEQVVKTDADGRYEMYSSKPCGYVFMSIPGGYEVVSDGLIPRFFGYTTLCKPDVIDFQLEKRHNNNFTLFISADTHLRGDPEEYDLPQFRKWYLSDISHEIERTKGPVYSLLLGDMTTDIMWHKNDFALRKYLDVMKTYPSPIFHLPGNHDNERFIDPEIPDAQWDSIAQRPYRQIIGPNYYSFNVGNVHVVSLKDIDYEGEKKYQERFGQEQLDWLKKDLSYVKPGTILFINVHAPVFNQSDKGVSNADDAEAFREIVKDYNTHIFAGHTHYYENNVMSPTLYEHNIGAACGAWWAGDVNRCGAPNGYLVVEVKGSEISWHYKATNQPDDYQFRVYKPGEFKSYPDYLVVNVWDWDPSWKVCYSEKAGAAKEMERVDAEDQDYIDMNGKANGYLSEHLFRCQPSAGSDQVTVTVTNRWGEVFTKTISLR